MCLLFLFYYWYSPGITIYLAHSAHEIEEGRLRFLGLLVSFWNRECTFYSKTTAPLSLNTQITNFLFKKFGIIVNIPSLILLQVFLLFFLVKQGNEVLILSVNYSTPDITTLLNYPTYTDVAIISKDSNRGKKFHFKLLLLPRSHVQLHIHKNKLLLTW
jgi:hypothetical protein